MQPVEKSLFSVAQWIAWLGAAVVVVASATSVLYANFETKSSAVDRKADIVSRMDRQAAFFNGKLDRMEDKLDRILEGQVRAAKSR